MTDAQSLNGPTPSASEFVPCGRRMDAPWFCVWTKPAQERRAEHALRTAGFPTFFPTRFVKRAKSDLRMRLEMLFPRYGFIQPNSDGQWVPALYEPGVAEIIRSPNGRPLSLPPGEIEKLFAQCARDGVIYPPEPREVARSDHVRVEDGPFHGFSGICQRTSRDRVWIMLSLFGRQSEVPFTRAQVELIAS